MYLWDRPHTEYFQMLPLGVHSQVQRLYLKWPQKVFLALMYHFTHNTLWSETGSIQEHASWSEGSQPTQVFSSNLASETRAET